jgi:hypothetical protein
MDVLEFKGVDCVYSLRKEKGVFTIVSTPEYYEDEEEIDYSTPMTFSEILKLAETGEPYDGPYRFAGINLSAFYSKILQYSDRIQAEEDFYEVCGFDTLGDVEMSHGGYYHIFMDGESIKEKNSSPEFFTAMIRWFYENNPCSLFAIDYQCDGTVLIKRVHKKMELPVFSYAGESHTLTFKPF